MTPKEEAKELVDKYLNASFNCKDCDMPYCDIPCTSLIVTEAKECALIAVDEILIAIQDIPIDDINWDYWQQVKEEIQTYGDDK